MADAVSHGAQASFRVAQVARQHEAGDPAHRSARPDARRSAAPKVIRADDGTFPLHDFASFGLPRNPTLTTAVVNKMDMLLASLSTPIPVAAALLRCAGRLRG